LNKILVFDILGDFAHFKRIYTTTSAYSYSVPPKTTIIGLIGAIMGYSKYEYYKLFDKFKVSVKILRPTRKIIIKQNYLKTDSGYDFKKGKIKERSQIPIEFIKNPAYRIYVLGDENEEDYKKLKEFLSNEKSYYTIYLGITECLAYYKYKGEFDIQKKETKVVNSIVPDEYFDKAKISKNNNMSIEDLPTLISYDRTTKEVKKFLISEKIEMDPPIEAYYIPLDGGEYVIFYWE